MTIAVNKCSNCYLCRGSTSVSLKKTLDLMRLSTELAVSDERK